MRWGLYSGYSNSFSKKVLAMFDLCERILQKITVAFYRKYCFRIEHYFYANDKRIYFVALRVINKGVVCCMSIGDIVSNKKLINKLHPYDSYLIGMIEGMQRNNIVIEDPCFVDNNYDDFIIEPYLEWVETNFTDGTLIFQPINSTGNQFSVPIKSIYENVMPIRGVSSVSAFCIGNIVTEHFTKFMF